MNNKSYIYICVCVILSNIHNIHDPTRYCHVFSNIFCRTISLIKGWDVHPVARTGSRYSIGKEGLVEWFGEFKAATLCVL